MSCNFQGKNMKFENSACKLNNGIQFYKKNITLKPEQLGHNQYNFLLLLLFLIV